jgi:hypothetical protein
LLTTCMPSPKSIYPPNMSIPPKTNPLASCYLSFHLITFLVITPSFSKVKTSKRTTHLKSYSIATQTRTNYIVPKILANTQVFFSQVSKITTSWCLLSHTFHTFLVCSSLKKLSIQPSKSFFAKLCQQDLGWNNCHPRKLKFTYKECI